MRTSFFTATYRNIRGFTLVETLVAISILLIAIAAPLTIAARSLQNIILAREEFQATMLAQEGLEAAMALQRQAMITAIKNGGDAWSWYGALDASCKSAVGCGMDFSNSGGAPVDVTGSCGIGNNCQLYFNDAAARTRFSHRSSGGAEITPYSRSVRVYDVGTGYPQVMIESEVTWTSPAYDTTRSVIVRTTTLNFAADSI